MNKKRQMSPNIEAPGTPFSKCASTSLVPVSCANMLLLSNGFSSFVSDVGSMLRATAVLPKKLLYIGYALQDEDTYIEQVAHSLAPYNVQVTGIQHTSDTRQALMKTDGVFVDGGNTFRLLGRLQKEGLVELLKERVCRHNLSYIGLSAGSVIAGMTVEISNDANDSHPDSYAACGMLQAQIMPHFSLAHEGKIKAFQSKIGVPVIGLPDDCALHVTGGTVRVSGSGEASLYLPGEGPVAFSRWQSGSVWGAKHYHSRP